MSTLLRTSQPRRRRGFNLVEAAIVLGVVGLVIGGIWVAASSVSENMKRSRAVSQLLEIHQNIRRVFAGSTVTAQFGYGSGTSNITKAAWTGVIPADMVSGATLPQNPWGQSMYVAISSGRMLTISFDVDKASCIFLGPRLQAVMAGQFAPGYPRVENTSGDDVSTPANAGIYCAFSPTSTLTFTLSL